MTSSNEIKRYLAESSDKCEFFMAVLLQENEKELNLTQPDEEFILVLEDVEVLGLCVTYITIFSNGD